MATIRARIPQQAMKGEVIQIRALIQHPMETGFRRDQTGKPFPRRIIHAFACRYRGEIVFRAEFFPAVSADPFLAFHIRAEDSGEIELSWTDDNGEVYRETQRIAVT